MEKVQQTSTLEVDKTQSTQSKHIKPKIEVDKTQSTQSKPIKPKIEVDKTQSTQSKPIKPKILLSRTLVNKINCFPIKDITTDFVGEIITDLNSYTVISECVIQGRLCTIKDIRELTQLMLTQSEDYDIIIYCPSVEKNDYIKHLMLQLDKLNITYTHLL